MDPRAMKLRMLKRVLFPPEVCLGKGSIERLACLDPGRVLVVAGRSSRQVAGQPPWSAPLAASELAVVEFSGEPSVPSLESFRTTVAAFAPAWIVAVGGGSVMDAAKFLWAQYEHPELALSGTAPVPIGSLRRKARFAAVPTTAGSGSEASQAAVLTAEDNTKIPYVSPEWVPDLVILDPELTVSLPRHVTVSTGFDALTHAVESAVSSLGNTLLLSLAGTAVGLILRCLPAAAENPRDLAAREGMLEAAYLAGLCQSTASTGAAHALSHAMTKLHGVPHAAATGFYLLPTMCWNRTKNRALYDPLAGACGLDSGSALETAIADLATRVSLPRTFAELLGHPLDSSARQALANAASRDVCLRTNPCRMTVPELAAVGETPEAE